MTILNIRSTHGGGKSWIVHQLLKEDHHEILDNSGRILGYCIPKYDLGVVGRYSNVCGGCDGIKTAAMVCDRVRDFANIYRHVVFEGILVSHTFGRYRDLALELSAHDFRFLFLNTPLAACISRVKQRRAEKGKTGPFDPKNVIKDYHNIWKKVRRKCQEAQLQVEVLDWEDPMAHVLSLLSSG